MKTMYGSENGPPLSKASDTVREENEEKDARAGQQGELLSVLSHEMRTPLAGALGMLDLALAGELSPEQRRTLELANASTLLLLRVVENVHDLARIESGRLKPDIGPFEVKPWVEGLREDVAQLATVSIVTLQVDIDPRLPDMLLGDVERLRRVLLNLMDHLVKVCGVRDLRLHLELTGQNEKHLLLITLGGATEVLQDAARAALVADCGRADTTPVTRLRELGLKLTLSRKILAALGGALWPGTSSRQAKLYALCVPVGRSSDIRPRSEPIVSESRAAAPFSSSGAHILVVEDDDAIRKLVELLLQQRGWRVTAVADGQKALEACAGTDYSLVLMDIRMPCLDGLEVTRRIRERERAAGLNAMPIIGMTAHAAAEDRQMCLQAGMTDHLCKPISSERLFAMIERHLAGG
jgi:CheY-like chemotaxis protein